MVLNSNLPMVYVRDRIKPYFSGSSSVRIGSVLVFDEYTKHCVKKEEKVTMGQLLNMMIYCCQLGDDCPAVGDAAKNEKKIKKLHPVPSTNPCENNV